jgi:uncharacterized protein
MLWGITVVVALALALTWILMWWRARFQRLPVHVRSETRASGTMQTVSFQACDGTRLEGWLFLPTRRRAPLVIMAPGLGGTKDAFLESFAWTFAEAGVAALAFDYRCFGGSDGTPRHWVDPERHARDYESALRWVQETFAASDEVDTSRVGLWGSSFSGGTAIVVAARNPDVRALVVQGPYLETPASLEPRGWALARFVVCATLDLLPIIPPVYVPLFGRPGEWVFASSRENPSVSDFDGPLGNAFWRALPKPGWGGWQNRMLARGLTTMDAFVPMRVVEALACPTLFVAAREDDLVPLAFVEAAHARVAGSTLAVLDCGHFDLYLGPSHEANALRQAAYFAAQLGATR